MREQAWQGIDPGRSGRLPTGEPGEAWAEYALSAPVMLVQDGPLVAPVTQRVPFRSWVVGEAPIERRPTLADLDYHLTTLFPPVRPRGYVEIRCLDAVPGHWWPALATITTVLIDDFLAADVAAEACEPLAASWHSAAYGGLADSAVGAAARRCVAVAAERCPPELAAEVQAFAEAVEAGRGPLDEVRDRVRTDGPLAALAGYARE
jgi:glutamate--cysteine ligase